VAFWRFNYQDRPGELKRQQVQGLMPFLMNALFGDISTQLFSLAAKLIGSG
jgi:hypothetical protein